MTDRPNQGLDVEEVNRVLEVTSELLTEEGLQADFVEKIARRVGILPTRIFLHFGGASRLMQALMEKELALVAGSVPAPELRFPGENIGDELRVIARILVDECRNNLGFLSSCLGESMRNPEFAQVFYVTFIQRGRRLFSEFLTARKQTGEIRESADIEAAAAFFLSALIFSTLALELFGGRKVEQVDDSRLAAGMSDLFLQGLLPR